MPENSRYLPYYFELTAEDVCVRILRWFEHEGREFPWRSVERAASRPAGEPIHDPYMILISEVMLQQTQTPRVVEKLPQFLEKFPTVEALASASKGDLIRAWQGMGYNRRALRLQETARAIVEEHGGTFPSEVGELASLPGIGPYTASAIACFAFGREVPVVDVNIIRVLSRLFFKCHTPGQLMPQPIVDRVAAAVPPPGEYYRWHQALMDFGATICTARRPACERCPASEVCLSAFPMRLELFGARHAAGPEPEIRGEPRRVWRGRIVEMLRGEHEAMRVGEIIDRLFPQELFEESRPQERRELLRTIEMLLEEGMIERAGVVAEGGLGEYDMVRLPG